MFSCSRYQFFKILLYGLQYNKGKLNALFGLTLRAKILNSCPFSATDALCGLGQNLTTMSEFHPFWNGDSSVDLPHGCWGSWLVAFVW